MLTAIASAALYVSSFLTYFNLSYTVVLVYKMVGNSFIWLEVILSLQLRLKLDNNEKF